VPALAVPDYATSIKIAVQAAEVLFLDQAPAQRPRHLSMRILAQQRRTQLTVETALATARIATRH
jgi:hypothetical protein